MLRLRLLDSGAEQHAFLDPRRPAIVWKIPGVCDELLPTPPGLDTFAPTAAHKLRAWRAARPLLRAPPLHAMADAALRTHLRHRRVRRFRAMLHILEALPPPLRDALVLPCVPHAHLAAELETPAGVRPYRGPAVEQRRADRFMGRTLDLDFDWDAVVHVQHALWRQGVGLGDAAAVLGPHDWAVLDGRVRLGDTGSLTHNLSVVRATLHPRVLAAARGQLRRRLAGSPAADVDRYFRTIEAGMNLERLTDIWEVSA